MSRPFYVGGGSDLGLVLLHAVILVIEAGTLASQGTRAVSGNITAVSQAAQQTGTEATKVFASAAALAQNGEAVRAEVAKFLREVRAGSHRGQVMCGGRCAASAYPGSLTIKAVPRCQFSHNCQLINGLKRMTTRPPTRP